MHLRDLAQFDEFNASYTQQFPSLVKPVRTTVGCDLAAGMRVEVTVVARRPGRAASAVTPAGKWLAVPRCRPARRIVRMGRTIVQDGVRRCA